MPGVSTWETAVLANRTKDSNLSRVFSTNTRFLLSGNDLAAFFSDKVDMVTPITGVDQAIYAAVDGSALASVLSTNGDMYLRLRNGRYTLDSTSSAAVRAFIVINAVDAYAFFQKTKSWYMAGWFEFKSGKTGYIFDTSDRGVVAGIYLFRWDSDTVRMRIRDNTSLLVSESDAIIDGVSDGERVFIEVIGDGTNIKGYVNQVEKFSETFTVTTDDGGFDPAFLGASDYTSTLETYCDGFVILNRTPTQKERNDFYAWEPTSLLNGKFYSIGTTPWTTRPSKTWDSQHLASLFQNDDGTVAVASNDDPVGTWYRRNFTDYLAHAAKQSTAGNKPLWKSEANKGLYFDGSGDILELAQIISGAAGLIATGHDCYMVVFESDEGDSGSGRLLASGTSSEIIYRGKDVTSHVHPDYAGLSIQDLANTGAEGLEAPVETTGRHLMTFRRRGDVWYLRIDDQPWIEVTKTGGDNIMRFDDIGNAWKGYITAVHYVPFAPTNAQIDTMVSYMADEYDITAVTGKTFNGTHPEYDKAFRVDESAVGGYSAFPTDFVVKDTANPLVKSVSFSYCDFADHSETVLDNSRGARDAEYTVTFDASGNIISVEEVSSALFRAHDTGTNRRVFGGGTTIREATGDIYDFGNDVDTATGDTTLWVRKRGGSLVQVNVPAAEPSTSWSAGASLHFDEIAGKVYLPTYYRVGGVYQIWFYEWDLPAGEPDWANTDDFYQIFRGGTGAWPEWNNPTGVDKPEEPHFDGTYLWFRADDENPNADSHFYVLGPLVGDPDTGDWNEPPVLLGDYGAMASTTLLSNTRYIRVARRTDAAAGRNAIGECIVAYSEEEDHDSWVDNPPWIYLDPDNEYFRRRGYEFMYGAVKEVDIDGTTIALALLALDIDFSSGPSYLFLRVVPKTPS